MPVRAPDRFRPEEDTIPDTIDHIEELEIVREVSWPVADLRIDWTEACPIVELAALWALYKPQLEDYVARALMPTAAPTFGVPGDL